MKMATWNVVVNRFFVETAEVNKKGNHVSVPVTHRKLFVLDPKSLFDSGDYRIVVKKGKYTISVIPRHIQPYIDNPSGKMETWYKLEPNKPNGERPYKRTDDPAMNQAEITRWLSFRLGKEEAERAIHELLTAEPQKLAA
jgi:hypothetical protein